MKRTWIVILAAAFLAASAVTAAAQQTGQDGRNGATATAFVPGQKIMGFDVAPGIGDDAVGADRAEGPLNIGPSETGLGVYKGMAFGEFDKAPNGEEFVCDFGASGVWVCNGLPTGWHQISGANPDAIVSGHFKSATYDEIIGDFGALGLWLWEPGTSAFPGAWTQLSGLNPAWVLAADDDNDTLKEIFASFGATGTWHYDVTNGWETVSGLNPTLGLRMDTWAPGWEEGCFSFGATGVWRIFDYGSTFSYQMLTGTSPDNDNASAKFTGGIAEDLIMDFAGLGLWLLTEQSNTDWQQISTSSINRCVPVKLGAGNTGLAMTCNDKAGLWYWSYSGAFPGSEVQLNATTPDRYNGFVEPIDSTWGDGDEELAVDMAASGLYLYEHTGRAWTQISGQNPVVMVAGDWANNGTNDYLLVNFGAGLGLYLYSSTAEAWFHASGLSPDYSIAF